MDIRLDHIGGWAKIAIMQTESFPSPELLGKSRQFGESGSATPIRQIDNNDWLLLIQMAETGEEVEYRYSRAEKDPLID